ncbi:hypothetical protein PMIN03_000332 [Paraphaeosphaeria minitans]
MASNRTTVFVTLTDYITVFPTSLHTTPIPGATTTLIITDYTTVFPSSSEKESISDGTSTDNPSCSAHTIQESTAASTTSLVASQSWIRSSSTSSPMTSSSIPPSPISRVSSSLEVSLPSFVFPTPAACNFSPSPTSTFSTPTTSISSSSSTPNPDLPTGWPTPEPAVEKHYNNTLPILMILWLVLTVLFFLGALIYFAWRFARGHCADCDLKTAEIIHLKTRLAGRETVTQAMVNQPETSIGVGLGRGREVNVSGRDLQGEGITFSLHDPERGIHVRLDRDDGSELPPPHSEGSDHFYLENAIPVRSHWSDDTIGSTRNHAARRRSAQSAKTLFRRGLSMEENRALALAELERTHTATEEELKDPIPFWKRALAHVGVKGLDRGEKMGHDKTDIDHFVAGPEYRSSMRGPMRTFSKPGPAPARPVPRAPTDPYAFNPRSAYFEDTGGSSSGRGSSNAVPKQYPQPTPQSEKSDFITVRLDNDGEEDQVDMRRATDIRNKRRTGGYGGMASLLPEGMDGYEEYPRGLRRV